MFYKTQCNKFNDFFSRKYNFYLIHGNNKEKGAT